MNARWARLNAAVERMRASSNQLYQLKINLFVLGAGRRLTQRNERLLAVTRLSFGVGETNCSQGKLAGELSEFQLPGFYCITSCKVTMNEAFPCEMILKFMEELKEHTIQWRIQTLS